MKNITASIIIRTQFKRDHLPEILKALSKQLKQNDEIIIVNDSDRATFPSYLKKKNIRVVRCNEHGYVQARNEGLKAAKKEIIAFLDDDCIPEKDWLYEIRKIYEIDKNIGGVGGAIIFYRERDNLRKIEELGLGMLSILFGNPHAVGRIYKSGLVTSNFDIDRNLQEVEHLNGSNMSFRKEAIKNVLADENYKGIAYREETDLCVIIKRKGYKIIFNPKAIVHHYIGKTRRDAWAMYWKNYNHYYFWKKHFKFNLLFFTRELLEAFMLLIGSIITLRKDYLYGIKGKIDGIKDYCLKN